jgi:hypothetical protein
VRGYRSGSDPEDLRRLLRAEVEKHPQAHHLALSFGKAKHRADEDGIDRLVGRVRAFGYGAGSRVRPTSATTIAPR